MSSVAAPSADFTDMVIVRLCRGWEIAISIHARSCVILERYEIGWGKIIPMRRRFAILLLALFSFSLLSPAFGGGSEANLPACCRHSGKHHCSMGSDAPQSGAAFTANRKCPIFPGIAIFPGCSIAGNVARTISSFVADSWQALSPASRRVSLRSPQAGAHHKRGPPGFLSI